MINVNEIRNNFVLDKKASMIISCYKNGLNAQIQDIFKTTTKQNTDEELTEICKICVTRKSFIRLKREGWLNDDIIDVYMKLLQKLHNSLHFSSSHFYTKLTEVVKLNDYTRINRWFKNVEMKEQKMLFFPINLQFHWKLVIIDIQNKIVYYLDSYNNTG
jgi:Ulp1 family protease